MHRYAIKIRKSDLPLITLLNGGVTPEIEKKTTYFVITIEDGENSHPEIISEAAFNKLGIKANGPVLHALKK